MTKQQELILHIAANLGRLARWAFEEKPYRIKQFLNETVDFVSQLEDLPKSQRFIPTYNAFIEQFNDLKRSKKIDERIIS